MGKSLGRRCYDVYDKLPPRVKHHTDKAIRVGAKATKNLRDKKQIESRGKASVAAVRRRLRI